MRTWVTVDTVNVLQINEVFSSYFHGEWLKLSPQTVNDAYNIVIRQLYQDGTEGTWLRYWFPGKVPSKIIHVPNLLNERHRLGLRVNSHSDPSITLKIEAYK